jgi:hypothetical protein
MPPTYTDRLCQRVHEAYRLDIENPNARERKLDVLEEAETHSRAAAECVDPIVGMYREGLGSDKAMGMIESYQAVERTDVRDAALSALEAVADVRPEAVGTPRVLQSLVDPPTRLPTDVERRVFALVGRCGGSADGVTVERHLLDAIQDLAKFGRDDPVETFLPRLRDLVHRRFLSDRWDYDFITVFPGHEAGSLNPQLVELAMEGVVETSILYSPLLERTETTARRREKPADAREAVAHDPGETLRVRQSLDGKTVILLDDICTTGSSLLAGAHLLRDAGARRVVGLTLGFTPGGPVSDVQEIDTPDAYASELIAGIE